MNGLGRGKRLMKAVGKRVVAIGRGLRCGGEDGGGGRGMRWRG